VRGEPIRPDPFFKLSFVLSIIICVASLIPLTIYSKALPKEVAVHFGPDFKPNGWMPKTSFVLFYSLFVLSLTFMTSLISALAYLKPELLFNKREVVAVLLLGELATATTFLYLLLLNLPR